LNINNKDLALSIKSPLGNEKVINFIYAQLNQIYDLLEISFQMTYSIYSVKKVDININKLVESKDRIDELRKDIISYISKASPAMLNKEDWIRILTKLNGIADKSIGITYRLSEVYHRKWSIPKDVGILLSDLAGKVLNSFKTFREIVLQMTYAPDKALEKCLTIDKLEKIIDKQYREMSFKILEMKRSFDKKYVIKEIADMFEEISDTIQDMTDDIRIIILNII